MKTPIVGLVGYDGTVGVKVLEIMAEQFGPDFEGMELRIFSLADIGEEFEGRLIRDPRDHEELGACEVILACAGSEFTQTMRETMAIKAPDQIWVDASSWGRMCDDWMLVLDPINGDMIDQALESDVRSFAGVNCTTAIFLLGLEALFKRGLLIHSVTVTSMQAVSGAGTEVGEEFSKRFIDQMEAFERRDCAGEELTLSECVDLVREKRAGERGIGAFDVEPNIGEIDENGCTEEELKMEREIAKLRGFSSIPFSMQALRAPTLVGHLINFSMEMGDARVNLESIKSSIRAQPWVTLCDDPSQLRPSAVGGTSTIAVGRLRLDPLSHGRVVLRGMVCGDNLDWGAARPLVLALVRVLKYLKRHAA